VTERIFVALGSNLGDRRALIEQALQRIARLPGTSVVGVAPIEPSAPLLPPGDSTPQPEYLNSIAELASRLEPAELMGALKTIEKEMGRVSTTRWAPRLIDLDLILYGDRVIDTEALIVPHPGLVHRSFVLRPLLSLWPGVRDPRTGRPLEPSAT
jgi:2-amino-4-hydroxy-6-hydroxymethyldihydropteridine diphosphokinase